MYIVLLSRQVFHVSTGQYVLLLFNDISIGLYHYHWTKQQIIIINNFCIALFSGQTGVPKLTVLYSILQHFLSFTTIIHIIMTTNNV